MMPGLRNIHFTRLAKQKIFLLLFGLLLSLVKPVAAQPGQLPETIKVTSDLPYPLIGQSTMLRTEKGTDVNEVLLKQSLFKPFSNADIDLDIDGKYDFWFIFRFSSDHTPLFLTLPIIQNFEIELYRIDGERPVAISKGGILAPVAEKYLNYPVELFELNVTPGSENTYLLKLNRTAYKTFPARIMTIKSLLTRNHYSFIIEGILFGIILCVLLYHLLIYIRVREMEYLLLAFYMLFLILQISTLTGLFNSLLYFNNTIWYHISFNLIPSFSAIFSFWFSYVFLNISRRAHPFIFKVFWTFQGIFILSAFFAVFQVPGFERLTILVSGLASVFLFGVGLLRLKEKFKPAGVYLIAYVPTFFSIPYLLVYVSGNISYSWFTHNNLLISIALQAILFSLAIAAKIRLLKSENEYLLRQENQRLEDMVSHRTVELKQEKEKVENALNELKSTQAQLIHSEKMASLGELTAGIAHEIQNPLNFVNNFSEVSAELVHEMKQELTVGSWQPVPSEARDRQSALEILDTINQNLDKILLHGKRADAIVKGMLQHSRSSTGVKEPTDINALCNEYLRLAYHGLRAKDKSFKADIKTDFDHTLPKINVIPQDIGRVLLNLFNNAFYAVSHRNLSGSANLTGLNDEPAVVVTTKNLGNFIEIRVKDNGDGIPEEIKDKIFQPFFTTKPTGQGTGLGLSLSYDIVTKGHGGELSLETKEGEGSEFIIRLLKYDGK